MVKKKKSPVRTSKKVTKTASQASPSKSPKAQSRAGWFSWFKIGSAVVAFTAIAGLLSLDPGVFREFQANILGQFQVPSFKFQENFPQTSNSELATSNSPGILLAYDLQGENEKKLLDIFGTVFPDSTVKTVSYQTVEGKNLAKQLQVTELPALFFLKSSFENEKLSEVVKDLFTLQGEYYSLNVSLVNPSGQAHIKGPLNAENGIWAGDENAPITVYVYSDLKCQHCRAQERNNQPEFAKLIDEGILRVVYLDLPQNADSMLHSIALQCLYQEQQSVENYLSLRDALFARPNLSKAFTLRELKNAGIDYDTQCRADAVQEMFKNRLKVADADGVTGVPALYIGKSGGKEFIRFTGDKKFAEYQTAFDKLLDQGLN